MTGAMRLALMFVFLINFKQITSQNNGSVVNEIIERRLREFSELCPFTDTCFTNVSSIEAYYTTGLIQCCDSCRCDPGCGLNCCPDVHEGVKSEEDIYEAKTIQCVDAQYRTYSQNIENGPSFEMVSRCPFRVNDDEIATKCAREYHDVTLDVPLVELLPVLDNVTGLIYKNSFCARCHGVSLSNLLYGHLKYLCKNYPRNITYIQDFVTVPDVYSEDGCNFVFDIPSGTVGYPWLSKICNRNIIDRCNVTGYWLSYDRHIEDSCLSYKSIYYGFYKNVHCFLCNGFTKDNVQQTCLISDFYHIGTESRYYSFLTLLNWNNVEEINENQDVSEHNQDSNDRCLHHNLFDPSKRDQWPLYCTRGMVEINRMCLPFSNTSSSTILMDINLILQSGHSSQKADYFTLNDLMSSILDETEHRLAMLISRDVSIHNIKGTLLFKTDIEKTSPDRHTRFSWEELQSVLLKTQIIVENDSKMDLITTVLDFALGFTITSNFSYNFDVKFSHLDHNDDSEQLSNSICSIYLHRPLYYLCVSQHFARNNTLHFQFVGKNRDMYSHIQTMISIEPEPFCPRVTLPKQIFITCSKSEFITKLYSRDFLSKKLSENETHLLFCHEDFFTHLSNIQSEKDILRENEGDNNNGQALAVLTIVCLSISLTSLVLTLIVYAVYPVLRSLPGLINMALVFSLIVFQLISIVRTVTSINIRWLCSFFGILTHFSFILSFAWMFVCTFHMFKVFTHIRNRSIGRNEYRIFASYCIFTTGIALILVTLTVVVALVRSGGNDIGYGGSSCYIKNPTLIFAIVALPVALVIITNIAMFCVVIYKIQKHPTLASSNPKERRNIIIFAKLSTITGMTWLFGFVYIFTQIEAFAYIYVTLNAGQGVFIMISFVCNRRIFDMICKKKFEKLTTRQTTSTTTV